MERFFACFLAVCGAFLLVVPALADQAPYPKDQAALDKEYEALSWLDGAQDITLTHSNSHIHLPQGYSILLGSDAQRYLFLNNGVEFPAVEAVLYEPRSGADIDFEFSREGFVKDDDWSDVDADAFLKEMKENQHKSNAERVANGQHAFEVIGWIEPPTYNADTHVAHYVLELGDETRHWVSAVAVKLGRAGYHQVSWVGETEAYKSSGPAVLAAVLNSHSYDEGHQYGDFKEGDKVAAYGIAGLVAAVAGVKLGKGMIAAAIAFFVVMGKKAAILIIPAAIGIRAAIKRFFRRS